MQWIIIIPEQFTVKAHPALFEGEGRGKKKWGTTLLFQSTFTFTFVLRRVFIILEAVDHYTLFTYTFNNIQWRGKNSEEHLFQSTFTFKTSKPNFKVEYLKNGTR